MNASLANASPAREGLPDPERPVITSLLDTDLYKFTMMQAILHQHPDARAEYAFRCRNRPGRPLAALRAGLEIQLDQLEALRFTPEELAYLGGLRYIKSDFVDFLEGFRLRRRFIEVAVAADDPEALDIRVNGPMLHVMLFEVFVLALVNELYFRPDDTPDVRHEGARRLNAKVERLREYFDRPDNRRANPFEFFDFGTRRRFARDWQEKVVTHLAGHLPAQFRGTSNVDLARRHGLVPIGTMAHEYLQAHQAFDTRLRDFQKAALEGWVREYRGDLGIALTDVVGMDAFLADFDLYFSKLFDGLRHDSGDPFAWGEKAIAHFRTLGVNPADKRLVFSDGLDVDKALALYEHFGDRVKLGFGIGTHLTNDLGPEPLQIVMKMVRCNGQSVAKLSDSPGKTMSRDASYLAYLRDVFAISTVA